MVNELKSNDFRIFELAQKYLKNQAYNSLTWMPQENDKSPDTLQFPLPLRLKKKTEYGQMTHQTKACKPQKTKMAVNSSSVVPRLHSQTLFYLFERRSGRYGAPHETLRAKCRHIVLKIHEKNDRARGGSGPSVIVCIWKYLLLDGLKMLVNALVISHLDYCIVFCTVFLNFKGINSNESRIPQRVL